LESEEQAHSDNPASLTDDEYEQVYLEARKKAIVATTRATGGDKNRARAYVFSTERHLNEDKASWPSKIKSMQHIAEHPPHRRIKVLLRSQSR
jgi:hypothetical protein